MSAVRCPNCNKFVGLETQEPEVQEINVDECSVTASVRVVRACADCGEELKETYLDLEYTLPEEVGKHLESEGEHSLDVEEDGVELIEEGGGRYKKSYYGAELSFTVKCSCGHFEHSATVSDKCPASYMESMV